MAITEKSVHRLTNVELMKALAKHCGIHTEAQLLAFFDAVHRDMDQTMVNYQFGEMKNGELVLNEAGLICAEVILRFMPDNN